MTPLTGHFVQKRIPIQTIEAVGSDYLFKHAPYVIWRKTRIDGGDVYSFLHTSWVPFNFGDVFNVTDPWNVHPINRAVFEATYEAAPVVAS